ncbi:MAG: S9 family peptidase [Bacteroidales bacterium]|nr:S9 family peptidase [Bacteroidales bacterium]
MKKINLLLAIVVLFMVSCDHIKVEKENNGHSKMAKSTPATENIEDLPNIMTPEVLWKLGRVSGIQVSPDGNFVLFGISRYNVENNNGNRDLYVMPTIGGDPIQITHCKGSEFNAVWCPSGKMIHFLSAKSGSVQIWAVNPDGSGAKKITDIEGGVGSFKWSPDGSKILFTKDVKVMQTTHERYPDMQKANVRIIDDLMYRHWDHWTDASFSHIFIADYADGKIGELKDIMPGEKWDTPIGPWGGLEQINWAPDASKIAYACKKVFGKDFATQTNSEIYIYDITSGETSNMTEKGFDGYDYDPVYSPDGTKLVWRSMATPGFEADKSRIMMIDFATNETVELTEGFDQSSNHYSWSADGSTLFFISGIHATYQLYKMDVATKQITQITQGDHNYTDYQLLDDKLIACRNTMVVPSDIYSVDFDGNQTQISFINKAILDHLHPANFEKRWIETTDGKQMLTWVIYPPDFDSTKTYPTLLYCQGGPQSAVSQFFSYRWNFQVMASNGYIVVAPNRRGLPTFGQEWNDQISGDYGGQNIKDYLSAIDELAKESYVDNDNLGAIGASYGGFSVYYLAGHHEGRFSAFISHCGIFNFESMYASTEETFFVHHDMGGAYWENPKPKSYNFSPHKFVGNWDTPILVITGENDLRIPYTQSMEAFNAAQLRGIPSRFLFFPEESHFVVRPQNSIVWQREFKRFLDENLKK